MDDNRTYGFALVASVLGLLATAFFHPTGIRGGTPEEFDHEMLVNVSVHTLALVSIWVSFVGLIGLSRQLGIARPEVIGALAAFVMAIVGVIGAASLSGYVATELAHAIRSADEASRAGLQVQLAYTAKLNGAFAKVHLVASSVAILLWSVAMLRTRFAIALAGIGGVVALMGGAMAFSGEAHMGVHELMLIVLAQGVWMVWAGVLLIRSGGGQQFGRAALASG